MSRKQTVSEIMALFKSDICDHYCKYPELYESKYTDSDEALDAMMEDHCDRCPLNRLM